jgi:Leucine-rich repeat (LRR) protein
MNHFVFKIMDKLINLTTLNLSNCGRDLDNTPHLDKLVNLTDINMSHNNLMRIPEPVYLLDKLSRINFSHNQVRELSSLVDTWSDLVTLDMTNNLLTSLHPHICKCTKLKRLFLSGNVNYKPVNVNVTNNR